MVVNRKTVLNKYLERTAFVAGHTDCLRQNPFLRQWSADEEVGQRMRTLSGQQHETQKRVYGF